MGDLVNTWALPLGALALGLPVFIHWLTRPRPQTMPLSTVRFVVEALKQNSWWHRLRDYLLLILRTAAVLLIAAAMARPLFMKKPEVSSGDTAGAVRVVVLDVSQSMAAVRGGIESFERARAEAAKYLRQGMGFRANLILAGSSPRAVFSKPSSNLGALRSQLSEARPLHEELRLSRAIDAAGAMLATADQDSRLELVVVSDFQRSNWTAADFSALPEQTKIEFVSVASEAPLENASITAVRCGERPSLDRPANVEVEVVNHGRQRRQIQVALAVGDRVENASVECQPGGRAVATIPVRVESGGWQTAFARLKDHTDALAIDDERGLVLNFRRLPRVGMLTREDPSVIPSSSYYLDRALTAAGSKSTKALVDTVWHSPDRMKPDALDDLDALALIRPGRLEDGVVSQVVNLTRRGMPLLYVACDAVDADNLRRLAIQAGDDLQAPASFNPPPRGARRADLFLADVRTEEAPFAVFGDRLAANLAPIRFAGGLSSVRSPRALPEDILATYSDQTVCLCLTPLGRGSLAIWNVDLMQTNLPASPAFVPLVGELTKRQLADRQASGAIHTGERLVQRLPPALRDPSRLEIRGPDDAEGPFGELRTSEDGVVWDWQRVTTPGVYRVVDPEQPTATLFAASATIPQVEGDLASIDPELLSGRLAGGRTIHMQAAGDSESYEDTAWSWLAAGCIGCMLCEFLALGAFRV